MLIFLLLTSFSSSSELPQKNVIFLKKISVTENGGLSQGIVLQKEARTMLTCSTDVKVRLINEQMKLVFDFAHKHRKITKTYAKPDDAKQVNLQEAMTPLVKQTELHHEAESPVEVNSYMIHCKTFQSQKLQVCFKE